MQFEIINKGGKDFTDTPRALTDAEAATIRGVSRLDAIKLHRAWTDSTLRAAIRCVDQIQGREG